MRIRLLAIATFLSLGVANVMLNASGPTLAQIEAEIIDSEVEIGVIYDPAVGEVARFVGDDKAVSIPGNTCVNSKGLIFTHNHPGIDHAALSVGDVLAGVWCDFKQIRVVARDARGRSVTCVATRADVWPPVYTDLDEWRRMTGTFRWGSEPSIPNILNKGWAKYFPAQNVAYSCRVVAAR